MQAPASTVLAHSHYVVITIISTCRHTINISKYLHRHQHLP